MACQHGRPGKWTPILIHDEYSESQYEAYEYIYAPVGDDSLSLTRRDLSHGAAGTYTLWMEHSTISSRGIFSVSACYRPAVGTVTARSEDLGESAT